MLSLRDYAVCAAILLGTYAGIAAVAGVLFVVLEAIR